MRKIWSRIFLLCMACMISMCGLCLAADDGNWVKYYSDNSHNLSFYVDTNSIKTCEYGGHKYLDVKNASQGATFLEFHLLLDVENRTVYTLEMENKQTNWRSSQDISKITQNAVSFSTGSDMEYLVKLLEWVEQNRPDVINEIRTFNHSAAPEKTDVTGSPNVPSGGSLEDIVGDIEYEVLDSGAVKFKIHNSYSAADSEYHDTYYIFAKPNEYKDYPGTYMTGAFFDDEPELIAHGFPSYFGHAFDYDPKTQTFIFYWWDFDDPKKSGYLYKTRLTGKNTAYEAEYRGFQLINEGAPKIGSETAYRYMPYDSLPWKVSEVQPDRHIVYMEGGQGGVLLPVSYFDDNKCVWYGEVRNYDHDEVTNYVTLDWQYFDLRADLMKAVLAVNGNIGQAFCPVFFTAR